METETLTAEFEGGIVWIVKDHDGHETETRLINLEGVPGVTPAVLDRTLTSHGYERVGDWTTERFGLSARIQEA